MPQEKKIPTIKEIAKRLNVSVSTVSRALHNHPSIGLRTKMRVQEMAKELNYEPNQTAIFFKQQKTYSVGVVLPNLKEEFLLHLVLSIARNAVKQWSVPQVILMRLSIGIIFTPFLKAMLLPVQ